MLATSIRKDQIHPRYRDFAIIGEGTTSRVLAKDDDTVLMLTRDRLKMEWLRDGLMIGRIVDEYETSGHHMPGMDEMNVLVVEMPRLEPLSPENKKLVRSLLKELGGVLSAANRSVGWGNKDRDQLYRPVIDHYREREGHPLHELFDFLADYDGNYYQIDLKMDNFMQDRQGKLVLVDPVYSQELDDVIKAAKQKKREAQGGGMYRRW